MYLADICLLQENYATNLRNKALRLLDPFRWTNILGAYTREGLHSEGIFYWHCSIKTSKLH